MTKNHVDFWCLPDKIVLRFYPNFTIINIGASGNDSF